MNEQRKKLLVYAALNYAQCNIDELNEAFSFDDESIRIKGEQHPKFTEEEVLKVIPEFCR